MSVKKTEKDISGCENMIMKVVWDADRDLSTSEVIDALKVRYGKNYARTTVVTFIQRLIEKGYVTTHRKGKMAYVHASKNEARYIEKFLKNVDEFWFQGKTDHLFAALCKATKPSKEELSEMKKIIEELEK